MEKGADLSNDEWFQANIFDLVQKYPNQWIAVMDANVICTAVTKRRAESEARRLAGGREFSLYFIEPTMLQMGFIRGRPPPDEHPG